MKYLILGLLMLNAVCLQYSLAEPNSAIAVVSEKANLVKRHLFTSNVKDHEPVDLLLALANSEEEVYFYTDLRHFDGQRVVHRWQRGEQILAEVAFNVDGPRWRVWSKKQLLPTWTGTIRVSVVDAEERVLASSELHYINALESP